MFDSFLKKKTFLKDNIASFDIGLQDTKRVTEFYKESPFPNYKVSDNKSTILDKGNNNPLTFQFKKFIGFNKNILEVGCGTGQLSIYFAIGSNNNIVGLDSTKESLKLAKDFASKNNISNLYLVNADIFSDVLKDEVFDFVWCNGVLHHTKNPYQGFKIIIKSLKKDGYILVGLYNKIGRIRTLLRKYIYKIFGKKFLILLDPTLKNLKNDADEQNSWIRDQYLHPIESLHTLDEVIKWFNQNNIEFISSIPFCDFDIDGVNDIFIKKGKGTFFSRLFNQFTMIFNKLGSDGGLFVVIGKKKVI